VVLWDETACLDEDPEFGPGISRECQDREDVELPLQSGRISLGDEMRAHFLGSGPGFLQSHNLSVLG
jgi:hypothetical protein